MRTSPVTAVTSYKVSKAREDIRNHFDVLVEDAGGDFNAPLFKHLDVKLKPNSLVSEYVDSIVSSALDHGSVARNAYYNEMYSRYGSLMDRLDVLAEDSHKLNSLRQSVGAAPTVNVSDYSPYKLAAWLLCELADDLDMIEHQVLCDVVQARPQRMTGQQQELMTSLQKRT